MIADFLTIAVLQLSVVFGSLFVGVTPHAQGGGFQVREPFVHAPDLYAENLDFISTLVNLPGAKNKRSSWELSYQLYFVPEEKYQEALSRLPRGGSNPPPEFFNGRILLAGGHKKIKGVPTLQEQTITLNKVPFKQKVPDALRTKFGVLMTAYSVKIFDAELKNTAYLSGIFLTDPFEWKDQKQITRKTLYLNFSVSPDGTLNYSQVARTPRALTRQ